MSKRYWANYMAMHGSLEDAKDWTPKAEHCDLREYVPASDLAAAEAEREELRALLQKAVFVGGTENVLQAQALDEQKRMLDEYSTLVREACAQRDEALAALGGFVKNRASLRTEEPFTGALEKLLDLSAALLERAKANDSGTGDE